MQHLLHESIECCIGLAGLATRVTALLKMGGSFVRRSDTTFGWGPSRSTSIAESGMKSHQVIGILAGIALLGATVAHAADWPQWRGANRDARASGFKVPQTWPKELNQKWKTEVGEGDATPALVGDRVYVFARQGSDEVTLCLNAADGKEIWRDKYPAATVNGPSSREHSGPRSSPAVAEGKVVTFGVAGVLSCLDADKGTVVWRKESNKEFSPAWPMFYTAMSPLIVDGLC